LASRSSCATNCSTGLVALASAIKQTNTSPAAPIPRQSTFQDVPFQAFADDRVGFRPCSRTAPCKTFAGAISKTAVNGEINCLDPAGYGAVTITKSITIDCEDTQGSILAAGTIGVIINITSATDTLKQVRLRGISINGAATGIRGINFIAGSSLHLDEMFIHGFTNEGVLMNSAGGDLVVRDSLLTGNQGAAIRTLSTTAGAAGIIHVSITERPLTGISKASASRVIRSASCPTARPRTTPSTASSFSRRASAAPK
jgi:hypothetical protein